MVGGKQVENHATSWSNLQDCKISSRAEIPKLDRVWQKWGGGKKRLMIIVATTSLPAVDRPNANRWNAARSCQKEK